MFHRRADLIWLAVLAVAAGLALADLLRLPAGWAPLLMVALAYPAGRRLASLAAAVSVFTAVAAAGLVVALWRSPHPLAGWSGMALIEFLAAVLPWWAGRYQRLSAEQRDREHGIVAEQARLRERARIARDMHDWLGHELALIALHGGALELDPSLTDEQRATMAELRVRAVGATERLHDVVRVLGSSDAATDLQPADESIDDLVGRAAAAGLPVRLAGDAPAWEPMTGQAAHRVVQESLTNAARHAPGAPVTVTISPAGAGTRIDVVNETASGPGTGRGTGQGLIGLDERVRLAGGRLDAGPRPAGGWRVTAVLPDRAGLRGDRRTSAIEPERAGMSGIDIAGSRRLTRRRLWQTAAVPLGVVLALVAALSVAQYLAVTRTGLPAEHYGRMRLGQPQAEVEALLPPEDMDHHFAVRDEPPRPRGSTCRYYQAGDSLLDIDPQIVRICFAGGVLVSKVRLIRV